MSASACSLLSTFLMSVRVTNSVNGGRTGMNTWLSLTLARLYTTTESSLRRHPFLIEIFYIQWTTEITLGDLEKYPGPQLWRNLNYKPIDRKSQIWGLETLQRHLPSEKHPTTNHWITDRINSFTTKDKEKPEKKKDNLKFRIEHIWKPTQYSKNQSFWDKLWVNTWRKCRNFFF